MIDPKWITLPKGFRLIRDDESDLPDEPRQEPCPRCREFFTGIATGMQLTGGVVTLAAVVGMMIESHPWTGAVSIFAAIGCVVAGVVLGWRLRRNAPHA